MVDQFLRQPKERVLAPAAVLLGRSVHPTLLTLLAFGLGVAAAGSLWLGWTGAGLALWLLNRVIDGLDGTVARMAQLQSDWGGYLDILLDTVVYALIPLSLVLAAPSSAAWLALAALLAAYYINSVSWAYLAALLEKRQAGARARGEMTSVTMPTGLIEGTETVVFFTLFIVLSSWLVALYWTMAALVVVTTLQRLVWAAGALRKAA